MHLSQIHYMPLSPQFFAVLVGLFLVVLALIQLGLLRYAYMPRRGLEDRASSCCSARCSAAISIFRSAPSGRGGDVRPRGRLLRDALRRPGRGAMARHAHRRERRRRRDSEHHVAYLLP